MMGFSSILTDVEGQAAQIMLNDLQQVPWTGPLRRSIANNGGLKAANMSLLFELRFAHALHAANITSSYEIVGEGTSTLDFGFDSGGIRFQVEMMRWEETTAAKKATETTATPSGVTVSKFDLSTDSEDARQSEEGEMLKAVQRICQKCEKDGQPYKFPIPVGVVNVLMVDTRTFLDGMSDHDDFIQIALGGLVPSNAAARYWDNRPITGVFNPRTAFKGAAEAQERIHFIAFVKEESYDPGNLAGSTMFVANPHLFASTKEARTALATWPIQPAEVIGFHD